MSEDMDYSDIAPGQIYVFLSPRIPHKVVVIKGCYAANCPQLGADLWEVKHIDMDITSNVSAYALKHMYRRIPGPNEVWKELNQ